jgi:hypothetical protein
MLRGKNISEISLNAAFLGKLSFPDLCCIRNIGVNTYRKFKYNLQNISAQAVRAFIKEPGMNRLQGEGSSRGLAGRGKNNPLRPAGGNYWTRPPTPFLQQDRYEW